MDYDRTGTPPQFQSPSYEPRQKTSIWRILSSVMLVMSILANGFLLLAIIDRKSVV